MTSDYIVIFASDAKFFELVRGGILSVRDKSEGRHVKLAFLDLGCTEEQRTWLSTKVDLLQELDWEYSFAGRDQLPLYFKGLLAKPHLRRYFPGFEIYLWIDADAWIQDWAAVELFLEGARRRRGLATVPEVDRGFQLLYGHQPMQWNCV